MYNNNYYAKIQTAYFNGLDFYVPRKVCQSQRFIYLKRQI